MQMPMPGRVVFTERVLDGAWDADVGKRWRDATEHEFLGACARGAISAVEFDTWVVQDYLFVRQFVRMAARLLASKEADEKTADLLLGGLVALDAELAW